MQRYFLSDPYNGKGYVVLQDDVYHHIARVMRMQIGDQFFVGFQDEKTVLVQIEKMTSSEVYASIVKWEEDKRELPINVTIASGLPKGDKLELIVQKGTELGAFQFVPFIAARSIVKWERKKQQKKRERLEKIAKEAAEQAHRQRVPTLVDLLSFDELLAFSDNFHYKMAAYEETARRGETKQFSSLLKKMKTEEQLLLVFGPEGGFSEHEIDALQKHGFVIGGLGPRILRTETAPLFALSAIAYHFELMG
ncbi:16S rRNA (uracil(1498)-N(3))-methyltransferase [Bacillus chungangensis]|uniref:Ribosomal RNA small subunit methyltransferase E n=1 Tax=Bacillus chungangensis TaxID=587633 RepID=A0ABT9WLU6_9BACI|nr:16S rRNA (uracil(1498)-N(3))-methyltransferase [Bacillus chungangensis]MDQ0174192.1 16S rRNA (uracil1498-N3)-methyltransferase [Bacillus chungangensis]